MHSFERDGLHFDVVDAGPPEGEAIVLLHGWPGGAPTWSAVAPLLNEHGYRTLTPDQRGYSPGARPTGRKAYGISELVTDVLALLDAAGLARAHVVGHDWGGAVAWALATRTPARLRSLTVLSTPHPAAMVSAFRSSDQALRSSYMVFFQIPKLPERLMLARDARYLRRALERSGLEERHVDAYVHRQSQPGALTASLAWYRAVSLPRRGQSTKVTVPTRYVWSTGDTALGRRAAELTGEHVSGTYRFEVVDGASHWLPEQHADLVARSIIDHVCSPDVQGRA